MVTFSACQTIRLSYDEMVAVLSLLSLFLLGSVDLVLIYVFAEDFTAGRSSINCNKNYQEFVLCHYCTALCYTALHCNVQ